MKIAILTDGITPYVTGGMQQHSFYLTKYLTIKNCDITLVHCTYNNNIPDDIEINKILFNNQRKLYKIITLKFPKSLKFPGHYLFNSFRYSKLVFEEIKNDINEFDFIYIKGFSGWKLLNEKKGLISSNIGINFHGMNMFLPTKGLKLKLSNNLLKPFVRYNMRNSDFVFSYGGKVTSTLIKNGVSKSKIFEIPTGIERKYIVSRTRLVQNNKIKFLFVGRNDPLKGVDEIFKSLTLLDLNLFSFELIGPIEKKILHKNIKYHGLVSDVNEKNKIYDNCDVLLCPSYSEGMPNVIIEAMSRGLAIIATDVGAVSLLVSENNGVLIESPSYENIIIAIENMLSLNDLSLLKMKMHSLKVIFNSFTWEKVVKLTIEKISSLIKI